MCRFFFVVEGRVWCFNCWFYLIEDIYMYNCMWCATAVSVHVCFTLIIVIILWFCTNCGNRNQCLHILVCEYVGGGWCAKTKRVATRQLQLYLCLQFRVRKSIIWVTCVYNWTPHKPTHIRICVYVCGNNVYIFVYIVLDFSSSFFFVKTRT